MHKNGVMRGTQGPKVDLTGQRFGRLTVERFETQNARGQSLWQCRCSCGAVTTVHGYNLKRGYTRSCGCFNREESLARHLLHGETVGDTSGRPNIAAGPP